MFMSNFRKKKRDKFNHEIQGLRKKMIKRSKFYKKNIF